MAYASRNAAGTLRRTAAARWWSKLTSQRGVVSMIAFLCLWEAIGRLADNALFIVPFTAVIEAGVKLLQNGELQKHFFVSMQEFFLGFLLSSVVGILVGAALAFSSKLRDYADPLIATMYTTPIIALGPLLILWFGLGTSSKVAVVFLVAVFPVLINTYTGINTTPYNLTELTRAFGANTIQVYTKVCLPWALPFIIAGERLAVARGLVGVVVGELFGARAGLGYLILDSAQTFNTAALLLGVAVLAFTGVVGSECLKYVEYRIAPWRRAGN